jgi:NitT/TauT family transport system permease protein
LAPPAVFGVLFVAAWEAVVHVFDLKLYFLAPPSKIVAALGDNYENVWSAMKVSGANALAGLVGGTVLGLAVAFLLSRFRLLNELVTPLAVALNAIPIFVVVSVLNSMYPLTSNVPRRLTVTLIVYFIVLVNAARGLRQVDATHLELMRSYAASGATVLRKVRVPNMVPFLHTAVRIAAPVSVITAFVSEYFGGSQDGLGSAITRNSASSRNDIAWAYVVGACVLGLAFYLLSLVVEQVARPGGLRARRAEVH